jgi:hypothetical protein
MNIEWPLLGTREAAPAEIAAPPSFYEAIARIKASPALEAFARKRAGHIRVGHTAESDLTKPPGYIARQAKGSLSSFLDIIGAQRMNMPPARRTDCLKLVEAAGAELIALWERLQVEVPE